MHLIHILRSHPVQHPEFFRRVVPVEAGCADGGKGTSWKLQQRSVLAIGRVADEVVFLAHANGDDEETIAGGL